MAETKKAGRSNRKSAVPHDKIPPCQNACPLNQDVRGYLYLIAQNRLNEAARLIHKTNPLPSICGSICAHPCEDECRRGDVDQPLSIRRLKRYVMENAPVPYPEIERARPNGMKVAVVGSGPAGLTVAHDMALKGYSVSVYESMNDFGGSVRWGVPSYRLPLETIKRDIDAIAELGVEFHKNMSLGKDFTIQSLTDEGANAVVMALGLSESRSLPIPGSDHRDALTALPFLRAARGGESLVDSKSETIVIGSGDVAMDVSRTAVRLGAAKVRVACLEKWDDMPASSLEKREAIEEGVEMKYCGLGPDSISVDEDDRITGLNTLECTRVFDEEGRFSPQYDDENKVFIPGNKIIFAIGQYSPLNYLAEMGVELDQRGRLKLRGETGMTSMKGIFSCGEVSKGPGLVVEAMSHARKIASHVDSFLRNKPYKRKSEPEVIDKLSSETIENIKEHKRQTPSVVPVDKRVKTFTEVEKELSPEEAIQETKRCLNCGRGAHWNLDTCAFCLNCVRVCPYNVPQTDKKEGISIDQDQCQACGLCYSLCPGNTIDFRMDDVASFTERIKKEGDKIKSEKGSKQLILYCYYSQNRVFDLQDRINNTSEHSSYIGIPCVGKLKNQDVYLALSQGYNRVFVIGCDKDDCTHPESSERGHKKVDDIRNVLINMGYSDERLRFEHISELESELRAT